MKRIYELKVKELKNKLDYKNNRYNVFKIKVCDTTDINYFLKKLKKLIPDFNDSLKVKLLIDGKQVTDYTSINNLYSGIKDVLKLK